MRPEEIKRAMGLLENLNDISEVIGGLSAFAKLAKSGKTRFDFQVALSETQAIKFRGGAPVIEALIKELQTSIANHKLELNTVGVTVQ